MIQANELRIGNKVYDNGKICTIESINAFADGEADVYLVETGNAGMFIDPIPLTEDILLKCGATSVIFTTNNEISSFDIGDLMFEKEVNGYCVFGSEWTIGKPFHYLHQLQNLFFCLCGKELTIKL